MVAQRRARRVPDQRHPVAPLRCRVACAGRPDRSGPPRCRSVHQDRPRVDLLRQRRGDHLRRLPARSIGMPAGDCRAAVGHSCWAPGATDVAPQLLCWCAPLLAASGCFQTRMGDATASELNRRARRSGGNQRVFLSSYPPVIASVTNCPGRQSKRPLLAASGCFQRRMGDAKALNSTGGQEDRKTISFSLVLL